MRHFHQLYAGTTRVIRTTNLDDVIHALESHLDLLIATKTRQRLFVHAGVVGWDGQAILLPGRSCSGKTTLVAALLRAGATYYSDDYAVLDASGHAQPFPRPLSIREDPRASPRRVPAGELAAGTGAGPVPVGLIVVTDYKPGARWRPRQLSPGQILLALLANTVPVPTRPEMTLSVLRQVVVQAPALKGRRGEAATVADRLLGRCGNNLIAWSKTTREAPA
jgi:hypothetical protein